MVAGVVPVVDDPVRTAAGDDAPLPAVPEPRRVDGVLAVVPEFLFGQDVFVVAEAGVVVAWVLVGAAAFDVFDGLVGFGGDGVACFDAVGAAFDEGASAEHGPGQGDESDEQDA